MRPLLTPTDVANWLCISRAQVYRLKNELGCLRVGRGLRFREERVLRYLDDSSDVQTARPQPAPRRTRL